MARAWASSVAAACAAASAWQQSLQLLWGEPCHHEGGGARLGLGHQLLGEGQLVYFGLGGGGWTTTVATTASPGRLLAEDGSPVHIQIHGGLELRTLGRLTGPRRSPPPEARRQAAGAAVVEAAGRGPGEAWAPLGAAGCQQQRRACQKFLCWLWSL